MLLCSLAPRERQVSDNKRSKVLCLDASIRDTMTGFLAISLEYCNDRLRLLEGLFGETGSILHKRIYGDAFQICIAHGDQARAAVSVE